MRRINLTFLAALVVVGCSKPVGVPETPVDRANILIGEDRWEEAAVAADQAVAEDASAEAYLLRGKIRLKLKRHEQALDDFTQVIEMKPEQCDGYYLRAQVHQALGNNDRAMADKKAARDRDPEYALARLNTSPLIVGERFDQGEDSTEGSEKQSDPPPDTETDATASSPTAGDGFGRLSAGDAEYSADDLPANSGSSLDSRGANSGAHSKRPGNQLRHGGGSSPRMPNLVPPAMPHGKASDAQAGRARDQGARDLADNRDDNRDDDEPQKDVDGTVEQQATESSKPAQPIWPGTAPWANNALQQRYSPRNGTTGPLGTSTGPTTGIQSRPGQFGTGLRTGPVTTGIQSGRTYPNTVPPTGIRSPNESLPSNGGASGSSYGRLRFSPYLPPTSGSSNAAGDAAAGSGGTATPSGGTGYQNLIPRRPRPPSTGIQSGGR